MGLRLSRGRSPGAMGGKRKIKKKSLTQKDYDVANRVLKKGRKFPPQLKPGQTQVPISRKQFKKTTPELGRSSL